MTSKEAWSYIGRIKNRTKKAYATHYLYWLWGQADKPGTEYQLGTMAKQAIHFEFAEVEGRLNDR